MLCYRHWSFPSSLNHSGPLKPPPSASNIASHDRWPFHLHNSCYAVLRLSGRSPLTSIPSSSGARRASSPISHELLVLPILPSFSPSARRPSPVMSRPPALSTLRGGNIGGNGRPAGAHRLSACRMRQGQGMGNRLSDVGFSSDDVSADRYLSDRCHEPSTSAPHHLGSATWIGSRADFTRATDGAAWDIR